MQSEVKIALVDDHTLFRNGLKGLLAAEAGFTVISEAGDGAEFIGQLQAATRPDVVMLDIDMPRMDGFEVAEVLLRQYPEIRVVTLSMHGDAEYYLRMLSLGVKGFLLKSSDFCEVVAAIRSVANGATYFSQELLSMIVKSVHSTDANKAQADELSERELEILSLICKGLSNQEIGDTLFISKRTVDKHRANILLKTGTKNTANLVMYSIKHSLVKLA